MKVAVMPALNEEGNIAAAVRGISAHVDRVIVVDNGSTDATARNATEAGAEVVSQPERGYGAACLSGLARARELGATVLVFLDADGAEDPADAPALLGPVLRGECELTLGVRAAHLREPGSMTGTQGFGNWLAPALMRLTMGAPFTDLAPFKVINREAIDRLHLTDRRHGFTIEFLLEAHSHRLRVREVPVRCRARRSGVSKVSGTLMGSARAGVKILTTVGRYVLRRP